ncbi:hypothetical protein B0H13DRAFT_2336309 [Mycena leptocephala]|nr:hypothetical protein B0H13DRAFT_2336309 [Mycena leptocephala]
MLRGSGRYPRRSPPPSSPPRRLGPSALEWENSSSLAQETIERHLAAHEQHRVKQLGGTPTRILSNEKWLRNANPLEWQHGLVTLDDAEAVFPDYVLTQSARTITRPTSLPGFSILCLATTDRIAILPSTTAFKHNFSRMSDGLLTNLDWSNLLVAGGIVVGTLLSCRGSNGQWDASDIDLYVHGLSPDDATKKIRHVFDTFCANLPPGTRTFAVRNSKTITFYAKYPLRRVQIVLKLIKSPREVLLNFDLDICAMGWDGTNVWMLPRAARALETGSNVFTMSVIHGHYLSNVGQVNHNAFLNTPIGFVGHFASINIETSFEIAGIWATLYSLLHFVSGSQPLTPGQRYATLDLCVAATNFRLSIASDFARCVSRIQLSGFAMLMRPTTLWEMGAFSVTDHWPRDSSYEDTPAKSPDPEYKWDETFTFTGFLSHIHNTM